MPDRQTVRFRLRDATADCHDRVDRAFSGFDLTDPASYAAFLAAHARVLLPAEAALDAAALWPGWAARGPLLRADLIAMGRAVPAGVVMPPLAGAADRWGMLYVLEGSRLGGAMLARRVAPGLPTAYLAAAHRDGSWAGFGAALEAACDAAGAQAHEAWMTAAIAGARQGFALFGQAAAEGAPAGVVGAAGIEPATPPV